MFFRDHSIKKCFLVTTVSKVFFGGPGETGHRRDWTQERLDTEETGHKRGWTQERLDTEETGHKRDWTQERLDTEETGHRRD